VLLKYNHKNSQLSVFLFTIEAKENSV